MKRFLLVSYSAVLAAAFFACGDDETNPSPVTAADGGTETGGETGTGSETSTGTDSGTDSAVTDAGTDAAAALACTDAELDLPANDFRGTDAGGQGIGGADITFPTAAAAAQYTNRCVKIKVGQQITFAGSFTNHPLQQFAGTTPSPIPALTSADQDGGTLVVTFTAAGTFGFRCQFHPNVMNGAIKVVP